MKLSSVLRKKPCIFLGSLPSGVWYIVYVSYHVEKHIKQVRYIYYHAIPLYTNIKR